MRCCRLSSQSHAVRLSYELHSTSALGDRYMVGLRSRIIAALLLCLATPATVFAVGKGTPSYYDPHVIFDNSHSDAGFGSSNGWFTGPSTLDLVASTIPVETQHFVSPPNALRLSWKSAPGGDWQVTLEVTRR